MILKKLGICLSMAAMMSSTFLCENFMTKAWADTSIIQNNTFDNGEAAPWEVFLPGKLPEADVILPPNYAVCNAEGSVIDGKYTVKVSKTNNDRFGIVFYQKNLTFNADHSYELCFDVTADEDCKVYPKIGQSGDSYREFWNPQWTPINLKKGQTVRVHTKFTMPNKTYDDCEFSFYLSGDCAGKELPYTVSFDNIYLMDKSFSCSGTDSIPGNYSDMLGDVNGDNKCTIEDYEMLQKYISGSDDGSLEGTTFYFNNADMDKSSIISSSDLEELKSKFVKTGDVNGDEKVNIKDYIYLTKYIMNPESTTLADPLAADLNDDGEINQKDLNLLKDMIMK